MNEVVIVSAVRTPIGILNGGLSSLPAHELGAIVIEEALVRAKIDPGEVSEVIMGQVLTAAQGQNPARQASIRAKIPIETPGMTINQVCGSGLRSVALGFQAIRTGDSAIVLAGGQESMSLAPHAVLIRKGTKLGNSELIDTMIKDGLWDAFNNYHMGQTAENIAARWKITREEQDSFALESQQRAQNAQAKGKFTKEIIGVPVTERGKTKLFDQDEGPRPWNGSASCAQPLRRTELLPQETRRVSTMELPHWCSCRVLRQLIVVSRFWRLFGAFMAVS